MTFYDAIDIHLNKINTQLDYPINVVIGYYNSAYIDYNLHDSNKEIDEMLNNTVKDYMDISIIWLNDKNEINIKSLDNLNVFKNYSIEKCLNKYKYMDTVKNGMFKIYLCLLPENNKGTIDGINYINNEIQYPDINHLKYQKLYNYQDENAFIHAIYVEFIVRNAYYNCLLSDFTLSQENPLENESEEEYDIREMESLQKIEEKRDQELVKLYGLKSYEIREFSFSLFDDVDSRNEEDFSIQFFTIEPPSESITIHARGLSDEEFMLKSMQLKMEYNYKIKCFSNLKEKINITFKKDANSIIDKFPKPFKKRQDQLIKSLFIFDYIQANNKDMDNLNIPIQEYYENNKIKINNNYIRDSDKVIKEIEKNDNYQKDLDSSEEKDKIKKQEFYKKTIKTLEIELKKLETEKRKKIREAKKELKKELCNYTKMDPSKYGDSLFNEIAPLINEKPKQCTKIHNNIHKFIENKIT